ncbi:MAG: inositol monophosphatase [Gammaproteobacteria bacterium]|nr:inositol monophosphatase [Gammaproteobacteria bacterium]
MHPMLNIGIRAAHAAGDHIVRYVDRIEGMTVDSKGLNDFVSEVDKQAESIIIDHIRKAYPAHGILAEESGAHPGDEYQWVIDPLDGTTNFLHGFPQFAVSIGLLHKGVPDQAVIYDPLRQELFVASKGAGAQLNNRKIRVSKQRELKGSLLGTGFPYSNMDGLEQYLDNFRKLCPITAGIRRAGAASLDLAYVACGRLDGFWESGLKPWDIAAGVLLILEAGGTVSDIDKSENYLRSGNIVAGNLQITDGLLKIF